MASWHSVVPSESLGFTWIPLFSRLPSKWWLGLDTSDGSQCALYQAGSAALDHLGHHVVALKYGGDVFCHNRIWDILVKTRRQARIAYKVEVGNNLSRDHSKTYPADILLPTGSWAEQLL